MATSDTVILTAKERRVVKDKHAKFKGAARVWITHLDFPNPCRQIDREHVERLKGDFQRRGCMNETPDHWIPAMIDESILQAALEKLGISASQFKATSSDKPPLLDLGIGMKLECLHGQHRIRAAEEGLDAPKRWWVVELYSSDLERATKQHLREGYSYSANYTTGEIFRHMRLCYYDQDTDGVERWRGKLTDPQRESLALLLERGLLIKALDSVLHIQGVWRTFYLGSLDVFLNLKCDEEIACSIKGVKSNLTHIFGNDMVTMMATDPFSIKSIQSRAPALSKSDYEFVEKQMRSQVLFPGVTDPGKRADITRRLLTTEELIPSLYTVIRDIRYLIEPARILGALLPKSKKTLRKRFYFHFTGVESSEHTIEVQQSRSSYVTIPRKSLDAFDIAYQQLWLCSCRIWKTPNAYAWLQVATLADRLGFSCPSIGHELKKDPNQGMIEKVVLEALDVLRPNEGFAFDANQARPAITSLKDYLDKVLETPAKTAPPFITVAGSAVPLNSRCGYGGMDTRDLNHLFLDKIHAPLHWHQRGGDEISSFYVKRSRHRAFFGALDLTGAHQPGQSTDLTTVIASIAPQAARTPLSVGESTDLASVSDQRGPGSNAEAQDIVTDQTSSFKGLVVTFLQGNEVVQEVPYDKESVNNQAREYADQGKKLYLLQGGNFVWQDCFDMLVRTGCSTVSLSTVRPISGKRRRGHDLQD
ncbi:uncharacterized protein BP5553_06871 [Venustampulla echinocandica]|uniref:Uncharacterized protein n=1 Tax=Venustampulla echinocandica TaxID=2656787 RepID=A0A370TL63_9HELO|nr:uncharacterized protein BP5553_06871 [Venustampulla echinocandica]RDL36259.1 hypothetical protein BP5553_06871 [Venustampulla echinocandica]